MIWVLVILALTVIAIGAFALLVAGVRRTERRMGLWDEFDTGPAQSFARRVLGVYTRRPASDRDRHEVRR